MNTTRTSAALAALTALHAGDQDAVNAALEAAGEKPRDINDIALLPALGDMISKDVNELDLIDSSLADKLSEQQVLLEEPNPNIPEIVQAITQLLDVIETKHPSKAIAPTATAAVSAVAAVPARGNEELPELSDANIDPLDSEEDEPELKPDPPEEAAQEEREEAPLETATEMDAPPAPVSEVDVEPEVDGSLENELADPETEEDPESEEDDGDDEVEGEMELDGGEAVLALAGALATGAVTRADARDYIESLADAVVDDDTAATLRRVHEALGDGDYTDADVVKKLNTAASHYRDRLDEVCIDLPERIALAKPTDEPEEKATAPDAPKLVSDVPLVSTDEADSTRDTDDPKADDKKAKPGPVRIAGEPEVLEARVVITDEEDEVYEPPSGEDDDGDDLDLDTNSDGNEGAPPEQPPLLELDDEDGDEDDEWAGTQWEEPEADASEPSSPAPRPAARPMIQLATTQVPESEAASADDEEPEVVEQRELTPTPAPRQTPPPLQAAAPSRGPAPLPTPAPTPATPRGDAAEDTLEGLSPGETAAPASTQTEANAPVEAKQRVSMRTLGLGAALVAVIGMVALVVAAGGLALTGAGIGIYQLVNDDEQVAANPRPAPVVRPAPVAPRPQPTRSASVWDSAMESGGNVYVSTGSTEWVLYESRKTNDGVRYSGGMVNESCLSGAPGVHDASSSCPKRERLY